MARRLAGLVVLGALLVAVPRSARGDDAALTEARARLAEGKALYAQGRFEESRVKYMQACAVLPTPNCLRGLAVSEFAAGHLVEAQEHLRGVLADGTSLDEPSRRELTGMLGQAEGKTGHIAVEVPSGTRVRVADGPWRVAPVARPFDVVAGSVVVDAEGQGRTVRVEVDAPAGQVVQVRLFQTVKEGPPPPASPDKTAPPPPASSPRGVPAHTVVALSLGALAAGALVTGVVLRVQADDASAVVDDLRRGLAQPDSACTGVGSSSCARRAEAADDERRLGTASTVAFVGAGALAAGALAAWLAWPGAAPHVSSMRSPSNLSVRAAMVPSGGGLQVGGTF